MFGYGQQNARRICAVSPRFKLVERTVAGRRRKLVIYVPQYLKKTADGRLAVVIGFDSWSPDERHGLPIVNEVVARLCDDKGLIGAFAFPYPRLMRLWHGWNTEGGALRRWRWPWSSGYDDKDMVGDLLGFLKSEYGPTMTIAAGFGVGGMFAQQMDLAFPGQIDGVVSVQGTIDADFPLPREGSRILVVHGLENPLLRYQGWKPLRWKQRIHAWLLAGDRIRASRPDQQVLRYAVANGVKDQTDVTKDLLGGYFQTTRFGPRASGPITEILVFKGGHRWYARRQGGKNESTISRFRKEVPLPPHVNVNDWIVAEYGLDGLVPV